MYMSQHGFTPEPSKFDLWKPYNRNYMSLTSRVQGAALSRILRQSREPEKFFAIGIWTDREAALNWMESEEGKLGAKPNVDQGLYEGHPMYWSRWELADFAWGLEGPTSVRSEGMFVKLITWEIGPGMKAEQDAVCRATISLLSRQPGFICGETYCGHRTDRYQILLTFMHERCWPFGVDAPADIRLLTAADTFRTVLQKTAEPVVLDCTVWDWVWGPEQARLLNFSGSAQTKRTATPSANW